MLKILYATTNQGKLKEANRVLTDFGLKVLGLKDVTDKIPQDFVVEEKWEDFENNAVLKALNYGEKAQMLTLGEDSGLEIEALDGKPGVFSHRYGKDDGARIQRVLKEMKDVPDQKRNARFVCYLALYDPQKKGVVKVFYGEMIGRIANRVKGQNGFGYDPIFINELGKSNAEISSAEKNKISHRGKALQQLKDYFQKEYLSQLI